MDPQDVTANWAEMRAWRSGNEYLLQGPSVVFATRGAPINGLDMASLRRTQTGVLADRYGPTQTFLDRALRFGRTRCVVSLSTSQEIPNPLELSRPVAHTEAAPILEMDTALVVMYSISPSEFARACLWRSSLLVPLLQQKISVDFPGDSGPGAEGLGALPEDFVWRRPRRRQHSLQPPRRSVLVLRGQRPPPSTASTRACRRSS